DAGDYASVGLGDVDRAPMVVHDCIPGPLPRHVAAPRGSEQAIHAGRPRGRYTGAGEISGSIDLGVAGNVIAITTIIVGARLDECGIRPSSSGYARAGGRAVIGYACY